MVAELEYEEETLSYEEDCCIDTDCGCGEWLTIFCDYETVTLDSCDTETVFNFARSSGISIETANPNIGIHVSDKVFRISKQEHDVPVHVGSVITDSEGTEWLVYAARYLKSFCVYVLTARSIAACFSLLDTVDIFELYQAPDCDDCENKTATKRVGRVKGLISSQAASISSRNDARELVYTFTGDLVRWPLRGRPSANHRLKTKEGVFRIVRVNDGGPLVPFRVGLEMDSADCSCN